MQLKLQITTLILFEPYRILTFLSALDCDWESSASGRLSVTNLRMQATFLTCQQVQVATNTTEQQKRRFEIIVMTRQGTTAPNDGRNRNSRLVVMLRMGGKRHQVGWLRRAMLGATNDKRTDRKILAISTIVI